MYEKETEITNEEQEFPNPYHMNATGPSSVAQT
jgi:hypothetical protein